MLKAIIGWITGGALDRALSSVDKYVESKTDQDRIKADIVKAHITTRPDWLRAGGVWLMVPFVAVVFFHFGAVAIYSVLWCAKCVYAQTWTIAALPDPMNEWEAWVIMAAIGVLGLRSYR